MIQTRIASQEHGKWEGAAGTAQLWTVSRLYTEYPVSLGFKQLIHMINR
jgi:hypothetical protein